MEIRNTVRSASGFTLIEMIITIMVMGILLGIGVPSFVDTVRNHRIASASNAFVTSLITAREESRKRGVQVSLCIRATDTSCATGADDWSAGWLMFTDDLAPTGNVDAPTDVVLKVFQGGDVSMKAGAGTITFAPQGALATETITVTAKGCTGTNMRTIEVAPSGRVSSTRGAC